MPPTIAEELNLRTTGYRRIAGLDEVGRGCWAGPVVAAAVVLTESVLDKPELLAGVDDSKALSARQREQLYVRILAFADGWGVGAVPASVVDTHGILMATRLAMQIALLRLPRGSVGASGHHIELLEYRAPRGVRGDARTFNPGNAHIAFMVEDLDAAYADLKAKGVRFKSAPVGITHGRNRGAKAVYFLDPDDITLELIQPAQRPVADAHGRRPD